MRKRILLVFILVFMSVISSSCKEKKDEIADVTKNTSVYISDSLNLCIYNTDTLNPLKTTVKNNAEVLSLFYDSLFCLSSDFSSVLNLAESFSVSDNGHTFLVKIRKNVSFSDGTPLTSEDVCASINSIVDSSGYYKSRLYMISGATSKNDTVYINLTKPTANLDMLLDFPILKKSDANLFNDNGFLSHFPQGCGIYEPYKYVLNKEIHGRINKNHHSGSIPNIKNITIHIVSDRETAVKMLENGSIDVLGGTISETENYIPVNTLKTIEYNGCHLVFLGMNTNETSINTPKLRSMISDVVDRKKLTESMNSDTAITHFPIHPKSYILALQNESNAFASSSDAFILNGITDSNLDGILDITEGKKTFSLSYELLVNSDNPSKVLLSENIKKNLLSSGIKIKIRAFPFSEYKKKIKDGNYDFFLGEVELLPNFDFEDILKLSGADILSDEIKESKLILNLSEKKTLYTSLLNHYKNFSPTTPLYFKNETLFLSKRMAIENITTLNPYSCVQNWSFS